MLTIRVRAGMLRTWEPGHWPGLTSLLGLNLHWDLLPVVGKDLYPATDNLSAYLGVIGETSAVGVS